MCSSSSKVDMEVDVEEQQVDVEGDVQQVDVWQVDV